MRVAIPHWGDGIAPCFEYSASMAVFTVERGTVTERVDYPLRSRDPFDRVRLLRDQAVHTVICGGVQAVYEDALRACGIEVISWVTGTVDDLLDLYLRGRLVSGEASGRDRPGSSTTRTD